MGLTGKTVGSSGGLLTRVGEGSVLSSCFPRYVPCRPEKLY